jgi:hypothetical protein
MSRQLRANRDQPHPFTSSRGLGHVRASRACVYGESARAQLAQAVPAAQGCGLRDISPFGWAAGQTLDEDREAFSERIRLLHQLPELIPTPCTSNGQHQGAESVRALMLSIEDEYASNFKNRGQEPRCYWFATRSRRLPGQDPRPLFHPLPSRSSDRSGRVRCAGQRGRGNSREASAPTA